MGVVRGVATCHGRMMLRVMVAMYDHFQGTTPPRLICPTEYKAVHKNLLSKLVPYYASPLREPSHEEQGKDMEGDEVDNEDVATPSRHLEQKSRGGKIHHHFTHPSYTSS